jgi:hypothetical protein
VTPQWSTASLGIIMVQEQLEQYILPLADVLPAERLGPIYADVPKLACRTCHQGEQQPLNGLNVIANWPELAVSTMCRTTRPSSEVMGASRHTQFCRGRVTCPRHPETLRPFVGQLEPRAGVRPRPRSFFSKTLVREDRQNDRPPHTPVLDRVRYPSDLRRLSPTRNWRNAPTSCAPKRSAPCPSPAGIWVVAGRGRTDRRDPRGLQHAL